MANHYFLPNTCHRYDMINTAVFTETRPWTTPTTNTMEHPPAPKEFIEQVKDALEHLYDFPHLSKHPLGQTDPTTQHPNELPGQQLRKTLLVAIESLNPHTGIPFRSPQTRLYDLIRLRYVEGMTIQETAHEMRLSPRQTYRDLRRGEESIAAILWLQQPNNTPPQPNPNPPTISSTSSIEAELEQLQLHGQLIGMRSLIKEAQKAVERLATQRHIQFALEMPPESVTVSTYPIIARQLLINLFSHTIQQAQAGTIKLQLLADNTQTTLTLHYKPETQTTSPLTSTLSLELAERLKWGITQTDQPEQKTITLQLSVHEPTILLIDDNQGFIDLVNRFLTDHACRVIAATNPQEGLQLAQQFTPDAILLDIMMPEMDGWELLQRIRGIPTTAETPIIICSVFNDPELAHSLGASLSLPKPINQNKLLAALQQIGILEQPYP
jgi:CheY-like chemotaxis protein